jgi:hypothetical protein
LDAAPASADARRAIPSASRTNARALVKTLEPGPAQKGVALRDSTNDNDATRSGGIARGASDASLG